MTGNLFYGRTVGDLQLYQPLKSVLGSATIHDVIKIMQGHNIGSVVIVGEDNRPIGIFTERDLLMKVYGNASHGRNDSIDLYMTRSPKCVQSSAKLGEVAMLLRDGGFRHLVIIDESGVAVGALSMKDFLNFLVDQTIGSSKDSSN